MIGCELWSDDPGFAAATAATGVTGICGSGIIEVIAELYLAGVIRHDGTIDGELAARTSRIVGDGRTFAYHLFPGAGGRAALCITQNDVRAIQLAKAALYAGVRLLMERLAVDRVDRIRLAGAFGSHIDVKYAMVLGMIPDCALGNVSSAGNAAGTGARIALLDQRTRATVEGLVRRIEKIETAVAPALPGILRRGDGNPAPVGALPRAAEGGGAARGQGRDERRGPAEPASGSPRGLKLELRIACPSSAPGVDSGGFNM